MQIVFGRTHVNHARLMCYPSMGTPRPPGRGVVLLPWTLPRMATMRAHLVHNMTIKWCKHGHDVATIRQHGKGVATRHAHDLVAPSQWHGKAMPVTLQIHGKDKETTRQGRGDETDMIRQRRCHCGRARQQPCKTQSWPWYDFGVARKSPRRCKQGRGGDVARHNLEAPDLADNVARPVRAHDHAPSAPRPCTNRFAKCSVTVLPEYYVSLASCPSSNQCDRHVRATLLP